MSEIDLSEETTITYAQTRSSDVEGIAWDVSFAEQFGDDYLAPYKAKKDGQTVSGNTNRLVIEETDVHIKGKNGLDVKIKRQYDNQSYDDSYGVFDWGSYSITTTYTMHLYPFTLNTSGETIYVGFYTTDDFYTYMYEGLNITALPYVQSYDGVVYYEFQDVYAQKTEAENAIHLEYNPNVEMKHLNIDEEDVRHELTSTRMFKNNIKIGDGWELVLPRVNLKQSVRTSEDKSSYRREEAEYIGLFKDMNGKLVEVTGDDEFIDYVDESKPSTYTSSFQSEDNQYLRFESFYAMQELDDGTQYNFTVYDNSGLTYYFYNTGMDVKGTSPNQEMAVVAISDRYGNTIHYEYDNVYGNLLKIIDTYGLEISFTYTDGLLTKISYPDEYAGKYKETTYQQETLPASELANDSPLKYKEVNRLTVTNEAGEQTIYDSRETQVLNCYYAQRNIDLLSFPLIREEQALVAGGYNIERIIYPTGAQSRYKYKLIYPSNYSTKMSHGAYMVENKYDIINGQISNESSYTCEYVNFYKEDMIVTETNASEHNKTVSNYNSDGLIENSKTTGLSTGKYTEVNTTYSDRKPQTQTTNTDGQSLTVNTIYQTGYPNLLTSVSEGNKKITYTYHEVNGLLTEIPKITNYYNITSGTEELDYSVVTTLTDDNKSVACVQTIKNDILYGQTKYEYDIEGNVIKTYTWTKDSDNDGDLDMDDEYTLTNNSYQNDGYGGEIITVTTTGMVDADQIPQQDVSTVYTVDIHGNTIRQTDANGNITHMSYDENNRPTVQTYPNRASVIASYYVADCYTLITDEKGIKTKNIYDDFGRFIEKQQQKNGQWITMSKCKYDNAGRVSEEITFTAENKGISKVYEYDEINRVTKITAKEYTSLTNSNTLYSEAYTYSVSDNVLTTTKTWSGTDINKATEKQYTNNLGEVVKTEIVGASETYTTETSYDYMSRPVTQTDTKGGVTEYEYDVNSNVTKVTNPNGQSLVTVYDLLGKVIEEYDYKGNATEYTYDKLGRKIKQVSPFDTGRNSEVKTYYDKTSNVLKESTKTSDNEYRTTEYTYDEMGNVISAVTGKDTVSYTYDKSNRVTSMLYGKEENTVYSYDDTNRSVTVTDPMGMSTFTQNDIFGNPLSYTDKNGNSTVYSYSAYGVYLESINGTDKITYSYDDLGNITQKIYSINGLQKDKEKYTYDVFGRVIKTESANDIKTYTYDEASNVKSFSLNGENTNTYEYDSLNRLTKLTANDRIFIYEYDENSNLVKKSTNDISTSYSYNKANMIEEMTNMRESTVMNKYAYTYSPDGMRLTETEENGTQKSYIYDNVGRLEKETQTKEGKIQEYSYTYDEYGNRAKMTVTGEESYTSSYSYDLNNRLKTETKSETGQEEVTEYTYDKNGNRLTYRRKVYTDSGAYQIEQTNEKYYGTYSYDLRNRVTKIYSGRDIIEYGYNVNGLRKNKIVNGKETQYTWNGQNMVGETKAGETTFYSYDMTGIAISQAITGYIIYLKNAHGDITRTLDQDGIIQYDYEYDAFGNQPKGTTGGDNPFRYAGEYYDKETGNIYLRNRYYDSETGRFMTEDPIKDGMNWYVYCGNEPVMHWDPSGYLNTGYDENGIWHDWDAEEFGSSSDTYLILVDVTQRWNNATNEEDRKALHNTAEEARRLSREGTPLQYAQNKIMNELHDNKEESFDFLGDNLQNTIMGYGEDPYLWFVNMTCSDWNYKFNSSWQVPYDYFNGANMNENNRKNWTAWMYFDGMIVSADKFGNINLGYVGTFMGFKGYTLKNSFTMDKDDGPYVQYGIDMANQRR